jgi:hypothetical protein
LSIETNCLYYEKNFFYFFLCNIQVIIKNYNFEKKMFYIEILLLLFISILTWLGIIHLALTCFTLFYKYTIRIAYKLNQIQTKDNKIKLKFKRKGYLNNWFLFSNLFYNNSKIRNGSFLNNDLKYDSLKLDSTQRNSAMTSKLRIKILFTKKY